MNARMFEAASALKRRMHDREPVIGTWITLGHAGIAEICADAGFDWLVIDMEHSAISISEAADLIRTISLSGGVPLVRVPDHSPTLIKRVMDAGAAGVIVSTVNTAEQAAAVVSAVKYPAMGTRGVGLARAQEYGLGFETYKAWQEEGSIVVVQIEHVDGVANIDAICATPGLDGVFVGPYDLSGSMGMPGALSDPRVEAGVASVAKAAIAAGISAGYHVVPRIPEQVAERIAQGFNFVGYTLDSIVLAETYRDHLALISGLVGGDAS